MIAARSSPRRAPFSLIVLSLLLTTAPVAIGDTPPTTPSAVAAIDLGQGLRYLRVHRLPSDLPTSSADPGTLIIDLRFASSQSGGSEALAAWLKFRTSPASPTFVLCNEGTDAATRAALVSITDTPGLLTVGPAADQFEPDIALDVSADEDRAAYQAFESGTSLPQLLAENANKVRNDEAALARESTQVAADDEEVAPASDSGAQPSSPPPTDRVLQRAVHLHRGLIVLKRIPAAPVPSR